METDLTYLTDEVQKLNAIVTELQNTVGKLEKQNEFLARKIDDLDTPDRPSRRPPHY